MKIEKAECNYQVTECDLKNGEQITLDRELLIPVSVLDKIRTEIESLDYTCIPYSGDYVGSETCVNRDNVIKIIDKYRNEVSE